MARAIDTKAVALPAGAYDWRRTIAWIDHNGNETERARLRGLLGRPRPEAKVIRTLEARQNDDGGFPSELIQGRPSSIDTTALVLRWLQDLGTLAGPVAERVVTYLFTVQRPDGSWDQPPGLVRYGPPPRLLPGDSRVQALCTAQAAYWLVLLGHRHDHAVSRAMGYLRARQAADGRFLGYIRTTWRAAAHHERAGAETAPGRRGGRHRGAPGARGLLAARAARDRSPGAPGGAGDDREAPRTPPRVDRRSAGRGTAEPAAANGGGTRATRGARRHPGPEPADAERRDRVAGVRRRRLDAGDRVIGCRPSAGGRRAWPRCCASDRGDVPRFPSRTWRASRRTRPWRASGTAVRPGRGPA